MAKRRRHTPEQVIRKLREGERMLGEGSDLAAVCKHLEVSEQALDIDMLKELSRGNF